MVKSKTPSFPYITLYSKRPDTEKWDNKVYDGLVDDFQIGEKAIVLTEIYHKVTFGRKN